MAGLGDTIYARPLVRHLVKTRRRDPVVVRTAWPQLIEDLAYPIPSNSQLRTQAKNIARGGYPPPVQVTPPSLRPRYGPRELGRGLTTTAALELTSGVRMGDGPIETSLPKFEGPKFDTSKPIAVIRPATLRVEWPNVSRNPRTEYLTTASKILRGLGYFVVSVADIHPPQEVRVGRRLDADVHFDEGELLAEDLVGLVQDAAVVVGGVGFVVPLCIATGTPLVCIAGGQGAYNAPDIVVDPRVDSSRIRFLLPDKFCRCTGMAHGCRKTISGFRSKFIDALGQVEEIAA